MDIGQFRMIPNEIIKDGDKVYCIDDNTKINITAGKFYEVIHQYSSNRKLVIVNDMGQVSRYDRYRFLTIEEYRERQLNNILNEEY
jgi:hypothetical protein